MLTSLARKSRLLPLVALALLCACRAAEPRGPSVSSKPGWGWRSVPESARTTVRAVPAAARPAEPVTDLWKPGWGARSR